jgi:type VI secretion system secreted protein VgrG
MSTRRANQNLASASPRRPLERKSPCANAQTGCARTGAALRCSGHYRREDERWHVDSGLGTGGTLSARVMPGNMIKSIGPVTLSGPACVESAAVRSLRVAERLSEPFVYVLDLLTEEPNLSPDGVLGRALTVSLEVNGSHRHFNAFATQLTRLGMVGRFFHSRVELRPWLWFLSRTSNCRIFQRTSVPEIVHGIFRERGFTDIDDRLSGSYEAREYVVQYRESDLDFVCRLLEQEGIYFFFEHTAASHVLVLADSLIAHSPTPFYSTLRLLPPDQNREAHLDHISSWQCVSELETGAYALTDYDFEKPRVDLAATVSAPGEHPLSEYEVFDFPGNYCQPGEGNRYARTRLEELQAGRTRASGEANARGLQTGCLFTLGGHPVAAANCEYLLTSLDASIQAHELESGAGEVAPVFSCRFGAIASSQTYRPPRRTRRPSVQGVQTATVVGKAGEEIWTDDYGRVKLRFHWDRQSSSDEESSCWVRVAQAWAGSGFGALHVPRIGQEVIVEFLEGDPDRPIVTGRVYNFDNMAPYELPRNCAHSGIKSRSTPNGFADNANEVRFEDKKGAELFFMQAEKDHTTLVKNNQNTNVTNDRSACVGGNDSVSVGADRSVSVTGNLTVSVQGGQSTMSVTGKYNVSASDTIEVQAPTHIRLSVGASSITIGPSSITLSAGGGASLVLDANVAAGSIGGSSVFLDATASVASAGKAALFLDANALTCSSSGSGLFLDGSASLMSKAGDVLIAGKLVSLDGGNAKAKLDLDGSGATLAGSKIACNSSGVNEITGSVVKIN